MRKRTGVNLLIVVAVMVGASAIRYGYTEISTLAWHVLHGFHAELGEIRVRIPLAYQANVPAEGATLILTRYSGRAWPDAEDLIFVDFGKHPSFEARQAVWAGSVSVEQKKIGERTATFAGRKGNCVESIPVFERVYHQELLEKLHMRAIECSFGDDVVVEFIGSANLEDDFYNFIQTAEPVQRKH
jgi:hypothetical protein